MKNIEQLKKTIEEKENYCLHECVDMGNLEACGNCTIFAEWRAAESELEAVKRKETGLKAGAKEGAKCTEI